MSSYSAIRLFFRLEKPGRLPNFGNVGILYSRSLLESQQMVLKHRTGEQAKVTGLSCGSRTTNLWINRGQAAGWRFYSTSVSTKDVAASDALRLAAKKKPKTLESPKILLVSETKSISEVTLDEAHKIAERKTLHLVPGDSKLSKDKPVYRLVTSAEFVNVGMDLQDQTADEGGGRGREKKKEMEVKTVIMKCNTADNDVLSKVKQMIKWIQKGHQIRVMIGQGAEKGESSHVYSLMEENMKESGARFLQKVVKGGQIRFQINPPKEEKRLKKPLTKSGTPPEEPSTLA